MKQNKSRKRKQHRKILEKVYGFNSNKVDRLMEKYDEST